MDYSSTNHPPVLFIDGNCSLCNKWVQFVLKWEKNETLSFSPQESDYFRALNLPSYKNRTVVFRENGQIFVESKAILKVLKYLRFPWPLLGILGIIPSPILNIVYRWVAKNRYRWFGRTEQCQLNAAKKIRSRIL